jgi:hypothetical protein
MRNQFIGEIIEAYDQLIILIVHSYMYPRVNARDHPTKGQGNAQQVRE